MNLVIVESGTKAKIIEKYLNESTNLHNQKFKVIASQGHLRDLSKKNMGIDTSTFDTTFDVIGEKSKIISNLRKNIKDANVVYLASDHDREGEGIAWHIKTMFNIKDNDYKRILFNEITKTALENAVMNATIIDMPVVHSYLSRRILDRLVGFMISKLLWKSFDSNVLLTAGRVQSATLNIIINKESEIDAFESVPYWTIKGDFGSAFEDGSLTLYHKDNIYKCNNSEEVQSILKKCAKYAYHVDDVKTSKRNEKAPNPFTTSTLQQTSYSTLHLPIKMTMSIAQDLYEMGAITYMRTDSTFINNSFVNNATTYVKDRYGQNYVQTKVRNSKQSKNAQQAHEAIRPTNIEKAYKNFKSNKHEELYNLIWKRTVACFMSDAAYIDVIAKISSSELKAKDHAFVGGEKVLVFDGWLKLYGKECMSAITSDMLKSKYTGITPKPKGFNGHCIWTNPPSRYNESSIINKLEKSGVGRPSTYASIMSKLFEKQYIEKKDIIGSEKTHTEYSITANDHKINVSTTKKKVGEETRRLVPTDIGKTVNQFVSHFFERIVNVEFTSRMEESLDHIAGNTLEYKTFLKNFYQVFEQDYNNVASKLTTSNNKTQIAKDEEILKDADTYQLIKRITRYGPVIEKRFKEDTNDQKSKKNKIKSEYINLKAFLDDTNIAFEEITYNNSKLLTKLPMNITHDDQNYELLYGRYGFYIKPTTLEDKSPKSFRVYKNNVQHILNKDYDELIKRTVLYALSSTNKNYTKKTSKTTKVPKSAKTKK